MRAERERTGRHGERHLVPISAVSLLSRASWGCNSSFQDQHLTEREPRGGAWAPTQHACTGGDTQHSTEPTASLLPRETALLSLDSGMVWSHCHQLWSYL
jgi:hypothetical protein